MTEWLPVAVIGLLAARYWALQKARRALREARADTSSWLWRRRLALMRRWQVELVDVYHRQLQPVHVLLRPPPFSGPPSRPPAGARHHEPEAVDHAPVAAPHRPRAV